MLFRSEGLEYFKEHHRDFIGEVKECFLSISNHYKVELPVSEIAYIYDYINMNSKNKATEPETGTVGQEDE